MTRFDFLKSMGFTGAALTSCVHEEDTVVEALTLSAAQNGTVTTPQSSTVTGPTLGTAELNAIKTEC